MIFFIFSIWFNIVVTFLFISVHADILKKINFNKSIKMICIAKYKMMNIVFNMLLQNTQLW